MTNLNIKINSLLSWFDSMHLNGAYYGPVVHFWQSSFPYCGYGVDWRYEGLIKSFIRLHKLSKNKYFLLRLKQMGDFILSKQKKDFGFINNAFEGNPAFESGCLPHEPSVALSLLFLAEYFKSIKKPWFDYYHASLDFAEKYLIPNFWNAEKECFQQYSFSRNQSSNLWVPNKIATTSEFLFHLSRFSGKPFFKKYGLKAMQTAVSLIDKDTGGSFQSETNSLQITYYNSREIPALLLYGYKKEAKEKAYFIKKMWNGEFFDFALKEGRKIKTPVFIAGAGDILSSLSLFYSVKKYAKSFFKHQHSSGGFKSFFGLKNKKSFSFEDVLPVVGWNDKMLSFLTNNIEEFSLNLPDFQNTVLKKPFYFETKDKIQGEKHLIIKRKSNLPSFFEFLSETPSFLARCLYSPYKKLLQN